MSHQNERGVMAHMLRTISPIPGMNVVAIAAFRYGLWSSGDIATSTSTPAGVRWLHMQPPESRARRRLQPRLGGELHLPHLRLG